MSYDLTLISEKKKPMITIKKDKEENTGIVVCEEMYTSDEGMGVSKSVNDRRQKNSKKTGNFSTHVYFIVIMVLAGKSAQ